MSWLCTFLPVIVGRLQMSFDMPVNADAQGRRPASQLPVRGRRLLLRYATHDSRN